MKNFTKILWLLLLSIFFYPSAISAQTPVFIGTEASSLSTVPTYGYYNYGWSRQIYRASEFGGQFGNISSIGFYVSSLSGIASMNNQKIYFVITNDTDVTDANYYNTINQNAVKVFDGTIDWSTTGYHDIQLTTPFYYGGVGNLLVLYENHDGSYINNYPSFGVSIGASCAYNFTDPNFPATSGSIINQRPIVKFMVQSYTHDLGISGIVSPSPFTSITPNSSQPISFKIFNFGSSALSNFYVSYSINGGTSFVAEAINDTLAAKSELTHVFSTNANMLTDGVYHCVFAVHSNLDLFPFNDTIRTDILVCNPLSGNYSVGSSGADFPNLQTAINRLNNCGISGPVTLNIQPGTYIEQVSIGNISGTSATNTLRIKGAGMATVFLISPTANNRIGIDLNGSQHIIIDSLTIKLNQASYYGTGFYGIALRNHSNFNQIVNCTFDLGQNTYETYGLVTTSDISYITEGLNASTLTIKDNHFIYGNYAIKIPGYFQEEKDSNIFIMNNIFEKQTLGSIYVRAFKNVKVSKNIIQLNLQGLGYNAIQIEYPEKQLEIVGNKIELMSGVGININNYFNTQMDTASITDTALIANNFVSIESDGQTIAEGINVSSSDKVKIYHNSINIFGNQNGVSSSAVRLFDNLDATFIGLKNNILSNTASGAVLNVSAFNTALISDYNDLYCPNGVLVYDNQNYINFNSLSTWRDSTNQDLHSLNVDPEFYTPNNLHLTNIALNGKGIDLNIDQDIDGEIRNSTPDLGADEFMPLAYDLKIIAEQGPSNFSELCNLPATAAVQITFVNKGTSSVSNIPITIKLDGLAPITEYYTATLASQDTATYTFTTTLNLSQGGPHHFVNYLNLSNDQNRYNDTIVMNFNTYSSISSFPFYEGFEGVNSNYFYLQGNTNAIVDLQGDGNNSNSGLRFMGGNSYDWHTYDTLLSTNLYANMSHHSSASTCSIDATSLSNLQMSLMRKPSNNYDEQYYNFFWITANDTVLLKDVKGDSVWNKPHYDYRQILFNLSQFAGTNFTIQLHGLMRNGDKTGMPNYTLIDDIRLWEPKQNDIGPLDITVGSNNNCDDDPDSMLIMVQNFGLLPQTNFSVSMAGLFGDSTYNFNVTYTDTLFPNQVIPVFVGMMNMRQNGYRNLFASTNLSTDESRSNDTIRFVGMNNDAYDTLPFIEQFDNTYTDWDLNTFFKMYTGSYGLISGAIGVEHSQYTMPSSQIYALSETHGRITDKSLMVFDYRFLNLDSFTDSINAVISTDCGEHLTTVYSINPNNFHFDNNWHKIIVPIGGFEGEVVNFGFVGVQQGQSSYMLAFDNVGIIEGFDFNLGNDTVLCFNDSLSLNVGLNASDGYFIEWYGPSLFNLNTNQNEVKAYQPGWYFARVTNSSGITVIDSILISKYQPLNAQTFTQTNTICAGDSLGINVLLSGAFPMVMNWSEGNNHYSDTANSNLFRFLKPNASTFITINSIFDQNGCSFHGDDSIQITVNSIPNVSISGLSSEYCSKDSSQNIVASPQGGTFFGTGVDALGVFNPSQAQNGVNQIRYIYVDGNHCKNEDTITTIVFANPTVSIVSPIESEYCDNNGLVNLYAYPSGGTFVGQAISANVFDPSIANIGLNTIVYNFTDQHNCFNSDTIHTNVLASPIVNIVSNINAVYCQDNSVIALSATPSGGTYSGSGVSANYLSLSAANPGLVEIIYQYTDTSGCASSDTVFTTIHAAPVVAITTPNNISFCQNASSFGLTAYPSGGAFTGTGVSNSSFQPSNAVLGVNHIKYSYTNSNNCTAEDSIVLVVNQLPTVNFTSVLNAAYCEDATNVNLSATPTGGTFSGLGINSNTFHPSQAGTGSIMLLYTYTDANTCTNYDTIYTQIFARPNVTILTNLNAAYCQNNSSLSLVASPSGGSFSGSGVSGNVFDPNSASTGLQTIVYQYTDANGCFNSDSISTNIHAVPNVNIGNLSDVCANQNMVSLNSGYPTGGNYIGNGVMQNNFYPNTVGEGLHPIVYSFTDANLCTNSDTQNIRVISVPQAQIISSPMVCKGDTLSVTASGALSSSALYTWNFSYATTQLGTGAGPYQVTYDTAGVKSISLVVSDSGCTSSTIFNFTNVLEAVAMSTIVGNPNVCYGDSVVIFANNGQSYQFQWFDTSGLIANNADTLAYYYATETGAYFVKVTNNYGCSAITNTISVVINPMISSSFSLPAIACKNEMVNVQYIGQAGLGATYQWNFDNGIIASGSNAGPYNIMWNTDSIKTVSLKVMENNCSSPITQGSIFIESIPANITAFGTTSFCDGGNVTLSANSGPFSYEWYKNGVSLGAHQSLYNASLPGYYQVKTTNNTTSCSNLSDSVQVVMNTNDFNIAFTATPTSFSLPPFISTFTNQTVNANDYYWMWSFGDGGTSTYENPTHQFNFDGVYTVGVIAQNIATGCFDTLVKTNYITCTGGSANPCSLNPAFGHIGGNYICPTESVKLFAHDHTSGVSYQWLRDGILIGGAYDSIYYANQTGLYQLMITDATCSVFSQPFSLTLRTVVTPIILTNGTIQPCSNDSLELYVSTSFVNYQWSNGALSPNIYVNNSGSFIVTVTDNFGCHSSSAPYVVNASLLQAPEICIVGIDTATNHNRIVWERQSSSLIDSFKVYRESTVAGVYDLIASLPFSATSMVEDLNSNPAQRAYRYRITAIDTCGMETPPSGIHKTIHLSINAGLNNTWNLLWDGYQGFNFGSYRIYRGVDSTQMQLLTQIQSTLTSYTDLNPPSGNVYYQIEVVAPHACYPDSLMSKANTNYNTSRSNTANSNMAPNTGITVSEDNQMVMHLFPNPNTGSFNFSITNRANSGFEQCTLEVFDAIGSLLHTESMVVSTYFSKPMNLRNLSSGVYFIRFKSNDQVLTTRFIIE